MRMVLYGCILGAFVVLCILGTWQVKRLTWKEALIEQTQSRMSAGPVSIDQMVEQWNTYEDVNYLPVALSGTYLHDNEMYYYNTLNGAVGWNVFTPLEMPDGRIALVNRGFVPDQKRAPSTRQDGQITGVVSITGLARNPLFEKPNSFIPDNNLDQRSLYWKSYEHMKLLSGSGATHVPFFIDAGNAENPGGWPLGGTTRVSFPNNHLQYAITWYGLAFALLMVGGYFIYTSRKTETEV